MTVGILDLTNPSTNGTNGLFVASRVEDADGGGGKHTRILHRVQWERLGPWAQCTKADLTYWHCLDDQQWEAAE